MDQPPKLDIVEPERPKHPGGRPPKPLPDLQQVELLASTGLTIQQIAVACGIAYDTLNEQRKQHTEITEAIEKGRVTAIRAVSSRLFEMATSGNCIAATIYWLKIMGGPQWRQDQNYGVDVSGEVEHKIADERKRQMALVRKMTPEQIQLVRESQRQIEQVLQQVQQNTIETTATETDIKDEGGDDDRE